MSEMKKKWRYGYEKDNNKKSNSKDDSIFTYFCFNIYVYNVQPEIEINYTTGASHLKK